MTPLACMRRASAMIGPGSKQNWLTRVRSRPSSSAMRSLAARASSSAASATPDPYSALGSSRGGVGSQLNRDAIWLADGRYAGVGNVGVYPAGKVLLLSAADNNQATIDCGAAAVGSPVYPGDSFETIGLVGSITLRGVNVDNCSPRFLTAPANSSRLVRPVTF